MPLEPREAPSTCPNLSMFPPLTIPASECWTPLHPDVRKLSDGKILGKEKFFYEKKTYN